MECDEIPKGAYWESGPAGKLAYAIVFAITISQAGLVLSDGVFLPDTIILKEFLGSEIDLVPSAAPVKVGV